MSRAGCKLHRLCARARAEGCVVYEAIKHDKGLIEGRLYEKRLCVLCCV